LKNKLFTCLAFLVGVTFSHAQLLLNEILVNPQGNDEPFEFIEVKGTPGSTLNGIYICVFEGDSASAGNSDLVIPLNNITLGSNGLLFIGTTLGYPTIPASTVSRDTLIFGVPGGVLENGNTSFVVIFSPSAILSNVDYDLNNDGQLELPFGASIQDAVGWTNGDLTAIIYGGVILEQSAGTPDAAVRFYGNNTPFSKPAWYNGDLISSTQFDPLEVSANFPQGAAMTPGDNNVPNEGIGFNEVEEIELSFFPNPSNCVIYFKNLKNSYNFSMYSIDGKLLFSKKESSTAIEIPVEISNGFYLVKVESGNKIYEGKVAVVR
jgi:hypothetical protein